MAEAIEPPKKADSLLIPLAVLTLISGAGGGFLGWSLASADPAPKADKEVDAKAMNDGGQGREHADPHGKSKPPPDPIAGLTLKQLTPIVTNLAAPGSSLVRLEASILYDAKGVAHPDVLMAELTSDTVAYLRSVPLSSLEGAEGLRRLHEDLSDRVATRSEGHVRQLIIESLVVQ
jgi:flagellar FliL protein